MLGCLPRTSWRTLNHALLHTPTRHAHILEALECMQAWTGDPHHELSLLMHYMMRPCLRNGLYTCRRLSMVLAQHPMESWLALHASALHRTAAQRQIWERLIASLPVDKGRCVYVYVCVCTRVRACMLVCVSVCVHVCMYVHACAPVCLKASICCKYGYRR